MQQQLVRIALVVALASMAIEAQRVQPPATPIVYYNGYGRPVAPLTNGLPVVGGNPLRVQPPNYRPVSDAWRQRVPAWGSQPVLARVRPVMMVTSVNQTLPVGVNATARAPVQLNSTSTTTSTTVRPLSVANLVGASSTVGANVAAVSTSATTLATTLASESSTTLAPLSSTAAAVLEASRVNATVDAV